MRVAIAATLRRVTDALGDPRLSSDERSSALLRGEGSSVAPGHPVLGTPIGTQAYECSVVQASIARSLLLLDRLRFLLTSRQGTTVWAPDEFDLLVRFCVWSRPRHYMRTLPPGPVTTLLGAFQRTVVAAHLESIPASHLTAAVDIDPWLLAQLPGRFGGHGIMPCGAAAGVASHHDAGWYGGWLAVWHYIRAWVPHLAGRQLSHLGSHGGFAYQLSVSASWDRLAHAHTSVRAHHDSSSLLPADSQFPELHSRFTEGRLSPATVPLGGIHAVGLDDDSDEPSVLFDLDCADATCHPHAHRAASAVVASYAFLALYDASLARGRARLLDGSIARGPFSLWRRIPVPSSSDARESFFAFSDASDFPVALAIDLLVLPPIASSDRSPAGTGITFCSRCAPSVPDPSIGHGTSHGSRHFVTCCHGIRLSGTCHDPAVLTLGAIFSAALGSLRVYVDGGPGRDAALRAFMQSAGVRLPHSPDLVLVDFDGPRTFTLIEVKTFDVAGTTRLATSHTDRDRGAAHAHVVRDSRRDDYRLSQRPLPAGMRLVVVAISSFGAIGTSGQALLRELGRRTSGQIPLSISDEASWSVPQLAPFARMAVTFAVRRGIAHSVARAWDRVAALPPALPPPQPLVQSLAPPPILPLPLGAPVGIAALPLPPGFFAPVALAGGVPLGLIAAGMQGGPLGDAG